MGQFEQPRVSGDDCHETAAVQLDTFRECELVSVGILWQRDLWAVLFGQKSAARKPPGDESSGDDPVHG